MAKTSQPKMIDAANLPLSISAALEVPGYIQIGSQLKTLIDAGVLRTGSKLPSSRALADVLGVNRNTIVAAFEWLETAGLVEARGRAGTVVSDLSRQTAAARTRVTSRGTLPTGGRGKGRARADAVDFRLGASDPSPLPIEVWRRACREAGRHLPRADYGDPRGSEDLRTQIVLYLGRTRALRVVPEQVVVTAGAGQAIERIAEALLRPGDRAAIEDPGYPRASRAFRASGAELVPVDVGDEGIDCKMLCELTPAPRLVHVTPSHQYPLGARLSAGRRQQLIRWAHENKVLVIENDYDGEFRYGPPTLPTLAAMAGVDHVAYVGTFSKVLTPALRLGFFVGPADLVGEVVKIIDQTREPVSIVTQQIVAWLIKSGELEKHVRRTRRQYATRRAVVLQSLAAMPAIESVTGQAAGLHVVVRLREDIAHEVALARVARAGILVDRVADFCVRGPPDPRFLLAYGHLSEQQIRTGLGRLDAAIAGHSSARAARHTGE